ncbi:ESPR-type extended signal peptide-containing protein, partial [Burkholderia cenocepacia]
MNKTYRTVWNATTGTWTAAAETARMRTKSKTNTAMRSSVTAAVAVMAGVGGGAVSTEAMAQASNGNGMLGLCSPSGSPRIGTVFGGGYGSGTALTSGACGANPIFNNRTTSFMLYNNSTASGTSTGSRGSPGTEAGIQGSADGHLTLLGGAGVHVIGAADFSANVNMTNHRITGLSTGVAGTDAVNVNQLNAAISAASTASNPYVRINSTNAGATASGPNAVAIGQTVSSAGSSSVAVGSATTANGFHSIALGASATNANASDRQIAIGSAALTSGNYATAMGYQASATAADAMAFGRASSATNAGAVAIGANTTSGGAGSTAIGQGAAVVTGATNSVALGINARVANSNSAAIGSNSSAAGNYSSALGPSASSTGTATIALGGNSTSTGNYSIAIGGATGSGRGAVAAGASSIAIGTTASTSADNAVALGTGTVANRANTVSVGAAVPNADGRTFTRQIVNVAAGTQDTDAVNLGQMNAAISAANNPYVAVSTGTYAAATAARAGGSATAVGANASATGTSAVALGGNTSATGQNAVALGTLSRATGSETVAVGVSANAAGTNSTAMGRSAVAAGNNSLATGYSAQANGAGSIAVGSSANVAASSTGSLALGQGASVTRTGADTSNMIAIGTNARASDAGAGVSTGAIAIGSGANAGGSGSIMVGTNASHVGSNATVVGANSSAMGGGAGTVLGSNSSASGSAAVALGSGATASGANSVALGTGSIANANNTVSVGSTTIQRRITNLAAGTQGTDAVNVGQLSGVTKALGGGAGVGANGSITQPTYKIAGTDYHNVGDALDALAANGGSDPNAVTYDDATKDKVTLKGADGTTLSNVKAGVADMDAVNVSQLKDAGLIGDDGKSIAAVTYDRNADGTPNYGTVTLGNGAGPTQIKNVADATDDHDALNLGQLKDSGLVGDDGKGNLTSMAVTYDGTARDKVTLAGADGTTLSNVKAGVADMDAVNVSQLKDSGLIGDDGKSIAAVTYDRNTDGTPNYGSVTLGNGAGPTQIKNVADATDDHDALNLGQLKDSGLVGDDGKGNLTSLAVTYDDTTKDSVTLGGTGATTPVAIHNVKDGELSATSKDAVNGSQLFATNQNLSDLKDSLKDGGVIDPTTGESLAVVYDGTSKDKVTLAGADGTTLSNVKAGVADMDAVNVSQLKDAGLIGDDGKSIAAVTYDRNTDGTTNYGSVTLGDGAGPTQIKNVADATDDHDALNLGQLKDSGLVGDDGKGNLTSLAVTYDGTAKDSVTLGGIGATTPVALHNVADGVLSATSKDAVNGSQLFATNTRVGDLEDSLKDGGVIDPVTGESLAVVYDGTSKDKVTLAGADGTTLSNVKAGVADMDAVNVSQLKDSGLIGDDGKSIAAVTYDRNADDTPNYGSVTLGNGAGPTQIKNVADATDDHDALNLGQLKDSGLVGDDGKGNLTSLAVTYDDTTKDSVTLGGTGATTPVAIHNVKDGELSATSKDAVNGSQLFATNQNLSDLKDSLKDGGVIDPVTGELLAVVYDGTSKDKVTLAGADGTTLSNVKAGVADMDAVNVSQLKDSGLIDPTTGKAIAAVTYDRNADGTPNYGTVTLGNGAGPTQIKNVATGVDDLDAVNVKQLNTGLSDLRDEMSGGNLRFVKVNADPVTGTPAVASGALAVAIGSDARATSANSLALGSGARVTGNGSVAIGYNSVANQNNVVSVGDVGQERKIVNVADGDVAFQSTDAVNGGQLYAALNDLSTSVSSKTQQAIDTFSSEIDKKTKAAIDEVSSRSMQTMDVSDPLVAIEGLQGNNVASLNGADPATATAAAIGSSTAASGANAVAVGLQSGAGSNNSVAIGSFAQTGAGQDYSVAVGSNVQTNGTQAVALGANAQANGNYALAVGNNGAQAIGDGSVAVGNAANVRAGSTNAIAMGTGANVARSVEGAMALGANTTAGAANSVALGANAFSNRANTVSVGRAGAERQIVNVAAGTQGADAVNVSQLKGVTDALGGGAAVGADGAVTSPTYSLADPTDASKSKSYSNVGDALSNLDGRTTTNTENITVINKQLADSG